MAENVGSMEVVYSVVIAQAMKNLDKYNKMIEKTSKNQEKKAKTEEKLNKKQSQVAKVIGEKNTAALFKYGKILGVIGIVIGTVIGSLYGLIKASSYGSMYMSQFGAITQQLADTIMEDTGITGALDDLIAAYQKFVDTIGDVGAIEALKTSFTDFIEWLGDNVQFFTDIENAGKKFGENIRNGKYWETIKTVIWDLLVWIYNRLGDFVNWCGSIMTPILDIIKNVIISFWGWIKSNLIDKAFKMGSDFIKYIGNGILSLLNIVISLLPDGIEEKVRTLISDAYNWGRDLINKFIDGMKSIKIPFIGSYDSISGKK